MTVTPVNPSIQYRDRTHGDPERKIVSRLIRVSAQAGVWIDLVSMVNLYVALKSKPMAILTGLAQTGKVALVRALAQALIGDDPFRCQMMSGHAWWASQTGNVAFFTDMQARLNASKVLNLIEEAQRPENARRVYVACLTHISPAELTGFFSELACQLRHRQIMQLPGVHLTEPIPYPSNLFLIGTMDTPRFDWQDADLLAATTIISWSAAEVKPTAHYPAMMIAADRESEFLSSRIGEEWLARLKLLRILGRQVCSIRPVFQLEDLLIAHHIPLPDSAMSEVVIYLANAWSKAGTGLFDVAISRNAAMAADLALAQTILPRISQAIRSLPALRDQLRQALNPFPHSMALLERI